LARILNHITVARDGMHNGFPTLAFWKGAYWIGFRKGERHGMTQASRGCLVVSTDRIRWQSAVEPSFTGGRGGIGPLPVSDSRMAGILAEQVDLDSERRIFQQSISFTNDGYRWEEPVPIFPPNHAVFGIRRNEGLWYAMIYLLEGDRREMFLTVSSDLINWETRSRIGQPDERINESDIWFQPDGEAWVIARTKRPGDHAYFCTAKPPYTDWQFTDLKVRIHAPRIFSHKGELYVAGRCLPSELGETSWPFGHSLCIWKLTRGQVEPVLRLPAVGDCAYCSVIEDPSGRLCMAYYSMHAYYLGVVPPFKAVYPDGEPGNTQAAHHVACANDIYFAEIELS